MKKTIAFICVFALVLTASVATAAVRDGRKIVWRDEFDGKTLDMSKWRFRATMGSSDCVYANDARTVRVEDGCLHLQVVASGNPEKPQLLSQGVATHDTMGFKYGYLEMRAQTPFRHGAWPSFWMQTTPAFKKADWMSEVDIFEVFSSKDTLASNLHKWRWSKEKGSEHTMLPDGKGSAKRSFTFRDAAKLNDEYHVYGLEWTPTQMSFYVDDVKYTTYLIDKSHDFSAKTLPGMDGFHDFHSIIFNNEIFTPGHGWCPKEYKIGPKDTLPIDYRIDWIRLWQKPGEEIRFPSSH